MGGLFTRKIIALHKSQTVVATITPTFTIHTLVDIFTKREIHHRHPEWIPAVEFSLTNHILTDNATPAVVKDKDVSLESSQ